MLLQVKELENAAVELLATHEQCTHFSSAVLSVGDRYQPGEEVIEFYIACTFFPPWMTSLQNIIFLSLFPLFSLTYLIIWCLKCSQPILRNCLMKKLRSSRLIHLQFQKTILWYANLEKLFGYIFLSFSSGVLVWMLAYYKDRLYFLIFNIA